MWASTEGVLLTRLRGLPPTRKELDMEGGREDRGLRVSSCCVSVQVFAQIPVFMSVLKKITVQAHVYTVA